MTGFGILVGHRSSEISCRGERIRTSDLSVPNRTRYQTALRPDREAASSKRDGGSSTGFRQKDVREVAGMRKLRMSLPWEPPRAALRGRPCPIGALVSAPRASDAGGRLPTPPRGFPAAPGSLRAALAVSGARRTAFLGRSKQEGPCRKLPARVGSFPRASEAFEPASEASRARRKPSSPRRKLPARVGSPRG